MSRRESRLRAFAGKVRGFLRGNRQDGEFNGEIQEHLQLLADKFVAQGMSREEAAAAARRQFGNVTLLQEDRRELRTFLSIETLRQDLRYALRTLRRNLGFTAVAVLMLALGIGANTAIFQLIDVIRLRVIPVKDPQQLVTVQLTAADPGVDSSGVRGDTASAYPVLTNPIWEKFRDQQQVFDGVLASGSRPLWCDVLPGCAAHE